MTPQQRKWLIVICGVVIVVLAVVLVIHLTKGGDTPSDTPSDAEPDSEPDSEDPEAPVPTPPPAPDPEDPAAPAPAPTPAPTPAPLPAPDLSLCNKRDVKDNVCEALEKTDFCRQAGACTPLKDAKGLISDAEIDAIQHKLASASSATVNCNAAFAGKTISQWRDLNARTFKNYVNSLNAAGWAELDEHLAACGPANLRLNAFQRNCAKRQNGCKPADENPTATPAVSLFRRPYFRRSVLL